MQTKTKGPNLYQNSIPITILCKTSETLSKDVKRIYNVRILKQSALHTVQLSTRSSPSNYLALSNTSTVKQTASYLTIQWYAECKTCTCMSATASDKLSSTPTLWIQA